MDSILVEALVETRRVLDHLVDLPAAAELRLRRDLLERAAATLALRDAPRDHVVRVTKLVLDIRDEAIRLYAQHRIVEDAVADAMD